MIPVKSGPMPAGSAGAERAAGLEPAHIRFECIERVPGSFDRMF